MRPSKLRRFFIPSRIPYCPDAQELWEEAAAYRALTEPLAGFPVGETAFEGTAAFVLTLAGNWRQTLVAHIGGPLWLEDPDPHVIQPGMSGSPIVNSAGEAVGVCCLDNDAPNPRLAAHLPAGILRDLGGRLTG